MSAGRIESLRIRGFRSLADVDLSNLANPDVLIGPNGSGQSNFIRFFEMLSWMLRSRRLAEFIALRRVALTTSVQAFANQPGVPDACVDELRGVRDQFATPEDINEDSEAAPSKRLGRTIPRYDKVLHGPALAATIGLDTFRAECPRFDAWVTRLESLGTE